MTGGDAGDDREMGLSRTSLGVNDEVGWAECISRDRAGTGLTNKHSGLVPSWLGGWPVRRLHGEPGAWERLGWEPTGAERGPI